MPDPRVVALARELVFATVDGENERNAAFLAKHRPGVWPTFYVLDARDGAILGAWEGSASADELVRFVRGSLDARVRQPDPAVVALLEGTRAAASGRCDEAIRHHARALTLGGEAFARRGEAVKGLLYCQRREGRHAACVETGLTEVPRAEGASAPTDLAGTLLDCADKLPDAAARARAYEVAIARLRREVDKPWDGASIDDRSDALALLSTALAARGERAGAAALLTRQRSLLEEAAARATSPEARATFDYARMNSYLAAGDGARAVELLDERTKEMPENYEPRARLAQALTSLGRHEEALGAIESALARVKGPRRLRYLTMQADLLARLERREREREVVASIVKAYESLPVTQRRHPANVSGLTEARARLRRLR
jgi:thioredoxin-like negative regulator of GroEL